MDQGKDLKFEPLDPKPYTGVLGFGLSPKHSIFMENAPTSFQGNRVPG